MTLRKLSASGLRKRRRQLVRDLPPIEKVLRGLTPHDAFAPLMQGRTILELTEGVQVRRARVMGANRIELSGVTDGLTDRLKADGLFGEIISYKLRLFVPTDTRSVAVLAKLLDRYAVERVAERETA